MQKRRRATITIFSAIFVFVVAAFCFLSDDSIPTPSWLSRLEWILTTPETKSDYISAYGDGLSNRGNYDGAIREYNRALNYHPQNGATRYYLGQALYKKGRIADACTQWHKMEDPDEEFVSASVEFRLLSQSQQMLKKCHQEPLEPPKPAETRSFLRNDF